MIVNILSVRHGSSLVNLLTLVKLIPLVVFVALGLPNVEPTLLEGIGSSNWSGFGEALLLLMFAFGGYELISIPAGEASSPRRDVPKAFLTTFLTVTVFYLLIQIVAVGTLPELAQSETPLADAAEGFLGYGGGILIAAGGLIAIAGTNAGTMLAGPRVTYAMGERGQLPNCFAHVNSQFRTPDVSIFVYSGVALLLAVTGSFVQLVAVSVVARLFVYVTTCAAVPRLRGESGSPRDTFELPGGRLIPRLGVFCSIAVIASADMRTLLSGGVALAVGTLIYWIQARSPGSLDR
jgi:amino acid transporter